MIDEKRVLQVARELSMNPDKARKLLEDARSEPAILARVHRYEQLVGGDSVVGFDCAKYNQRKTTKKKKKKQVAVIEEWIDDIPDGQTRCVFKMFYRDGMTWEKIAAKTGYSQSPDYPRLHIRDAYLKKSGIK